MKFLKFQSEAAAIEAFAPWATDEATYPAYIGTVAVDVVGVIQKPTGEMLTDSEGNSYPDMRPIPGWHVNLSGEVPELAAFEIDAPDIPARIFAGAL
jgi:hypothetical protein